VEENCPRESPAQKLPTPMTLSDQE